jgi:hypothetical protein
MTARPNGLFRPDRRQFLVSVAVLASSRALGSDVVELRSFGAAGDGKTDDTAALNAAFNSGRPLSGSGRSYALRGNLTAPPGFVSLADCTLVQTGPQGRVQRTLVLDGLTSFKLRNVNVVRAADRGEALDATMQELSAEADERHVQAKTDTRFIGAEVRVLQARLNTHCGIWINGCSKFSLESVKVSGGGVGSGIVVAGSQDFQATDVSAAGIIYRLERRPNDDVVQGLWFNNCKNFTLTRPAAHNLGGRDDQGQTQRWTRALVFGGCDAFRVEQPTVSLCDQGLDMTGSAGNRDFAIVGGRASSCLAWGFKFAGSNQRGTLQNVVADDCGLGGFVFSGRIRPESPIPRDMTFTDCVASNCGNGAPQTRTFGFGLLATRLERQYPSGAQFIRCRAEDRRPTPAMRFGFFSTVEPAPSDSNKLQMCSVAGATIANIQGNFAT